jgi:hypothetical protein
MNLPQRIREALSNGEIDLATELSSEWALEIEQNAKNIRERRPIQKERLHD